MDIDNNSNEDSSNDSNEDNNDGNDDYYDRNWDNENNVKVIVVSQVRMTVIRTVMMRVIRTVTMIVNGDWNTNEDDYGNNEVMIQKTVRAVMMVMNARESNHESIV